MNSRSEFARAHALNQLGMPTSNDANLPQPQTKLASSVEQSSGREEVIELALQAMARDLMRHVARARLKQKR